MKTDNSQYKNIEEFWSLCAKLQKDNHYSYAEYWYALNDLFKNLAMISYIGIIISIVMQDWILFIVYIILVLMFLFRAVQFADYFVLTVCRLTKV